MQDSKTQNNTDVFSRNEHEKRMAAITSVFAAVGLTSFKIIVGQSTGSLGILAEAAHSGLDLVAAIITYFAIRISARPADPDHLYGHGKVENLSALFETLLLFATCIWIIYEAIQRLFYKTVIVDATVWSFIVMAVSIAVDYSRSRILFRVAKKHNSQALEADALHFSTDIWSSGVVILGLICVKISEWNTSIFFLEKADALAAFIVAIIVIYISIRLGIRTVQALIDAAPRGLYQEIKKTVEDLPGVFDCHNIRFRYSGPQVFIDVHILTDGDQSLASAHDLTMEIERAIQEIIPNADVTVHPEPFYMKK